MTEEADPFERVFHDPNILRPASDFETVEGSRVSFKCPHCAHMGFFEPVPTAKDITYARSFEYASRSIDTLLKGLKGARFSAGLRACPNSACRGLVLVVMEFSQKGGTILMETVPPSLIEVRVDGIPHEIAQSLVEAVASHGARAYRASTLMVRRTLEQLCQAKGAKGANLKERIGNLAKHVILPPALLNAADELRILGNDAAHVEAHEYDTIDKEHADAAIEVAKKILEAVYQYDDLIEMLKNLKKPRD